MKIGILGSRGIPNHYGGFEQFVSVLAPMLVSYGEEVWVYNSHNHPFSGKRWNGVNIIHRYDPEYLIGTAGQFVYDLNCILDSRRRNFDVLLQLGYTSGSVWHRFLPKKSKIITNMDGMEWHRSKYSSPVKKFLRLAEKLAINSSHYLVADAQPIADYISMSYRRDSTFIAYGAGIPENLSIPGDFEPGGYYLLVARLHPDNHIEEIIKGVLLSENTFPLVVVGATERGFGRKIKEKYQHIERIKFLGQVFDQDRLNSLRAHCRLYFHGHSAGGTNPSLLEAMAAGALICAHDNPFNRSVLGDNALYFNNLRDIANAVDNEIDPSNRNQFINNNLEKIRTNYNWELIVKSYHALFKHSLSNSNY